MHKVRFKMAAVYFLAHQVFGVAAKRWVLLLVFVSLICPMRHQNLATHM